MKAEKVGVPEVEARSSVPSQEISRRSERGGYGGGGGEDRVVLEGNPFDIVFGRRGPSLLWFCFLQIEVEPHFLCSGGLVSFLPAMERALKPWFFVFRVNLDFSLGRKSV